MPRLKDKCSGRSFCFHNSHQFYQCLDDCGLFHFKRKGPYWTSKRHSRSEQIDWGICNLAWKSLFLNSFVNHLSMMKCDHRPLLIHADVFLGTKPPWPFRFQVAWLLDNTFANVVANSWSFNRLFLKSLCDFKTTASQ